MADVKYEWPPAVIQTARHAAVSLAEFWDALREFEGATGKQFGGTTEMLGVLAADLDVPPDPDQLSDEHVSDLLDTMKVEGE